VAGQVQYQSPAVRRQRVEDIAKFGAIGLNSLFSLPTSTILLDLNEIN